MTATSPVSSSRAMVATAAPAAPLVPVFDDRPASDARNVLVAVPALNEERFIGSVVHGVLLEGFRCLRR